MTSLRCPATRASPFVRRALPSLGKKYHAVCRRANTLLSRPLVLGQGGYVGVYIAHRFRQALLVDDLGVLPTQQHGLCNATGV